MPMHNTSAMQLTIILHSRFVQQETLFVGHQPPVRSCEYVLDCQSPVFQKSTKVPQVVEYLPLVPMHFGGMFAQVSFVGWHCVVGWDSHDS